MRKRLTVEGDGGSDDKRIMSLVKTFVRWAQSTSLSEEEMDATYQKMLFTLGKGGGEFPLLAALPKPEMTNQITAFKHWATTH